MTSTTAIAPENLSKIGFKKIRNINYQLSPDELVMETIGRGEGILNDSGALVINTGEFTGRSPKDKFIVKDSLTADTVNWNEFNLPLSEEYFDIIYNKVVGYLDNRQSALFGILESKDAARCGDCQAERRGSSRTLDPARSAPNACNWNAAPRRPI